MNDKERKEKEPLKIGFIGGGPRAHSLWSSLMSSEEMEDLVVPEAIIDVNEVSVKEWRYKTNHQYTNFEKFLDADLDAVLIATPPSTHANLALRCLEAGINVWSEVPMGLTIEELYKIVDADKSNKGNRGHYSLGENYCYFIETQFIAMKNAQNAIGDIYFAEGEYTHSVEHYMIEENYKYNKRLDPELHPETKPTWRATFIPMKYGHAFGPVLYVLNKNKANKKNIHEIPLEVSCMGNMKMQKRFNVDNFQIAMVKTNEETIIKFVLGFVLGHHGRIFCSFWGSRGLFVSKNFQSDKHYYYEVPEDKAAYPYRHEQEAKILSDEDLIKLGTPHGPLKGGHSGSDVLMFQKLVESWSENKPLDIDVYLAAEMTAPGIIAVEAEKDKKVAEIPRFR
ncbi:MAG: Gfo/Idh/MocA family protein [Promethearchaeota archaeon]